ncbi:MAG TPA: hypothetical protein VHV29_01415 [Terriglobales bacterium]|nr:hypothetical protein [Terriglobales bacterium]
MSRSSAHRSSCPAYPIAKASNVSPATISRILQRAQLNRWRHLHHAPPIVRYEHPAPAIYSISTSRVWPAISRSPFVAMAVGAAARSSPAGKVCTSPSTITPPRLLPHAPNLYHRC